MDQVKDPLDRRFAGVKSISEPTDWMPPVPASLDAMHGAREAANKLIAASPYPGIVMRGLVLAISDAFEDKHLERGMASTMRAARNAFADRLRNGN